MHAFSFCLKCFYPMSLFSSVIWKREDGIIYSALPCYVGVWFTSTSHFLQLIKVNFRV